MVKVFFLIFFPILTLLSFTIYIYILFAWHQYSLQKDLLTYVWVQKFPSKKLGFILINFLKCLTYICVLFIIFMFYILKIQNIEFKLFFLNNLIIYQMFIFSIIFLLFNIVLIVSPNFLIGKSIDIGLFLIILFFICNSLLISNNLLIVFINLEIINVLIIYSFFITSYLNYNSKKNLNFNINWLINSTTYQFILNFFTSILFFLIFNLIVIYTNSTNFIFLNFFNNYSDFKFLFYISILYISIFIKFGIGPWIFFKIEIYQGFNLFLLIIYTLIYFLIILIFFLNLFIIYSFSINWFLIILLISFLILILVIFIFLIFFYFNIFMFFSFSSLLNLILILIQWVLMLIFI